MTQSKRITRRRFLGTGVAGAGGAAVALALPRWLAGEIKPFQEKPFELDEITVAELQQGMKSGRFTARAIAQKYLDRIATIDKSGPAINAVIELNPDALSIADALDAERKQKGPRGPMHGIPILIKDNIGTADRMMTTAGSLALIGFTPEKDSAVAQRLRESGAVILGKTNLSEWANFRSNHSSSGWSGRGGQTRNPYVLDRNPCGSSSGAGAGVAANLCAVTVGSETDGSIVCPSSANCAVGIKPTLGLLSRTGIIPIAHSQDTAGPICRTMADAAILLSAMAGIDPADAATDLARGKAQADYSKFLDRGGLKGARIGVMRKFFDFNDGTAPLMESLLEVMKGEGAVLIDPVDIVSIGKFDRTEIEVLEYEFKADLNAYLAAAGAKTPVHSLKEIIEFNEKNREKEMTFFGQDIMVKSEAKGPLTEQAYREALDLNHKFTRAEGIDAAMDKHQLDALVAPTAGPSWLTDHVTGDHDTGGSSSLAAVAGYPNINVPAGFIFDLPVGISFFGRAWSEPTLIKIAYAFEQATKVRKSPRFLATVEM